MPNPNAAPIFPPPSSYTDLDQAALITRLIELVGSVFPNLDVTNKAELARIMLEGEAYTGDILADLMRRKGRESRWGTAELRQSVLAHVKLLDYRPFGASAATVDVTFSLPNGAIANDIVMPADTYVRTPDQGTPIRFRAPGGITIHAGQTSVTVSTVNSDPQAESFDSTGRPAQRIQLSQSPYVDGSLVVTTTVGAWTEVRNFLDSGKTDRHFVTLIDSQDRCTVIFGDGNNGAIPADAINFAYATGGGSIGQLPSGSLTVLDAVATDTTGASVTVAVTNASATDGGLDRQPTSMIKLFAPASIRAPISSVGREDYEINALRVPGVARALHLTRNQSPAVLENEGFLFIVPTNGGIASSGLLTSVASQFGDEVSIAGVPSVLPVGPYTKTTTFQLRVRAAVYRTVDVFARLYLAASINTPARRAAVRAAINAALAQYFAILVDGKAVLGLPTEGLVPNPRVNFGWYLRGPDGIAVIARSDVYNVVRDTPGVQKMDPRALGFSLNGLDQADVPLAPQEFPALGTVTLINAIDGSVL